jgi:hypothetical protein
MAILDFGLMIFGLKAPNPTLWGVLGNQKSPIQNQKSLPSPITKFPSPRLRAEAVGGT